MKWVGALAVSWAGAKAASRAVDWVAQWDSWVGPWAVPLASPWDLSACSSAGCWALWVAS